MTDPNDDQKRSLMSTTINSTFVSDVEVDESFSIPAAVLRSFFVPSPDSSESKSTPFSPTTADLFRELGTSPAGGISTSSIPKRVSCYGTNVFPPWGVKSLGRILCERLEDPALRVLILAAIFSLLLAVFGLPVLFPVGDYETSTLHWDSACILATILVYISFEAGNLYVKDRFLEKLEKRISAERRVTVIRDSGHTNPALKVEELLVGDIVALRSGDVVPADCVLVSGELESDSSLQLGRKDSATTKHVSAENHLIFGDSAAKLYSGSTVTSGTGTALVLSVGRNTRFYRLLSALKGKAVDEAWTPLQRRMEQIANGNSRTLAILACAELLVAGGLLAYQCVGRGEFSEQDLEYLVGLFVSAFASIMVSVPSGMPLSVILSVTYEVPEMLRRGVAPRSIELCERLGCVSELCLDLGVLIDEREEPRVRSVFCEGVYYGENSVPKMGERTRRLISEAATGETLAEVAVRKFLQRRVGVQSPGREGLEFVSGNLTESLISRCTSALQADGTAASISGPELARIVSQNESLGCRSFLLAFRTSGATCTVVSIFGLEYPLRPDIQRSLSQCSAAGINVRLVSEESFLYAKATATRAGILLASQNSGCVAGAELANPGVDLEKLRVVYECHPEERIAIISRLRDRVRREGRAVACGWGSDTVQRIEAGDVIFTVPGMSECLRETAESVLLFPCGTTSPVGSMMYSLRMGRCLLENIRKFLQFPLVINVVSFFLSCATDFGVFKDPPLNAIQMMWINIVMNSLTALTLATEPVPAASARAFKQPPRTSTEPIITSAMLRNIVGTSIYQLVVLMFVTFAKPSFLYPRREMESSSALRNTLVFHVFIMMQLFNYLACRRPRGFALLENLGKHRLFFAVPMCILAIQAFLVQSDITGLGAVPLTLRQHLICLLLGANTVSFAFAWKALVPETWFEFGSWAERWIVDMGGRCRPLDAFRKLRKFREIEGREETKVCSVMAFGFVKVGEDKGRSSADTLEGENQSRTPGVRLPSFT